MNNFIHLIHKAQKFLSTLINVTVSIFTVSAFMFLTLTHNIPVLLSDIPQLKFSSITLDVWHFLQFSQSLLVRSIAMPLWSAVTIFLSLRTYSSPRRRFPQFSPQMVLIRILNMCDLDFCVVSVAYRSKFMAVFVDWSRFYLVVL